MSLELKNIVFVFICVLFGFSVKSQENWTHFRGNNLDGISESKNAPVNWSETNNIIWKTPLRGLAWSAPVVYKNQIWTSSATKDGKELFVVCTDYISGKIIKEITLFRPDSVQRIHSTNSYATSTPCIDNGFIYVHFGTYGTASVDLETFNILWTRTDINCEHMQGAASSPIIFKNLIILTIEGTDFQYITALDKTTGKTVWRTDRPKEYYENAEPVYRKSYSTPLIVEVKGKHQLISSGAQLTIAYEPETGKEIWQVFYGHDSVVGMPTSSHGLVFVNSGWIFPEIGSRYVSLFAVKPDGNGDVTNSHVEWKTDVDVPQISTPVIFDGRMYMVHERGEFTCLDILNGNVIFKTSLKDQFNASPIYASGNIYLFSDKGKTYVFKAGKNVELIAENQIEGIVKATPAIVRDNLIIRTDKFLYRIGN